MTRRQLICGCLIALSASIACGRSPGSGPLKELQRTKSGDLDIVLLSDDEGVRQGKDTFVLEFRRGSDLVDVGTVKVNATMVMAGMAPMIGGSEVKPGDAKGRYTVSSDLSMAGSWRLAIEWEGPAGKGSASLPATIR
ncbi:MAG TPA: FixH family protein [Vicinamibacterales bacterium]|nr:FixH family protein [Vicinamibacterales bacterium]